MSQNQQSFEDDNNHKYDNNKAQQNDKQQDFNVGTKLKYNLPKKIMANSLDDVGTKKLKTMDSFSYLCDRILSQTQKINKLVPIGESHQAGQQQLAIKQSPLKLTYDPHYHTGLIENYISITSQEDKQLYGMGNEGRCQHFSLNDKFLVVIVGRLPTDYKNGMKVGLYLPRQMVENPQNISIQNQQKQLVIIQRRSTNNDPNFLNSPYIILQPQILLYPSYLCSWIQCKRRVSLVNYITSQFEVNQHLVFGSACHRYMEWLLDGEVKVNLQSYHEWKQTVIKKVYQSFLYDMYLVKATFQRFFQYCEQSLTNIRQWVKMFIINKKQMQVNKYNRLYLRIEKVVGSETMHRSGYFGLKGKTDGLFKGKLINKKSNTVTEVYIPFQLKTGKKPSQSHKRQTDIYNMLLRQRQKLPVIGLLYYSQSNITIFRQQNKQVAFQTIVIHRNTIVMNLKKLYMGQQILLPQMTTNGDNCRLCEMAVACEVVQENVRGKKIQKLLMQKQRKKRQKDLKKKQKQQQKGNNIKGVINSSSSQQKAMLLNSLFDSQSSQQQQHQNNNHLLYNNNLPPLPSTHNPNAKITLQSLTLPQRKYLTKWIQMLHLQQREIKQQLQKSTAQGYGNFILRCEQLQKINKYFNQTKLESKLVFNIEKRYRSLDEMHKLLSNYTVSLKLRILIQHLGIMQGCKITKITKLANKLILEVQMNSLQVVMNRRALMYSIENRVQHDVELERFESLQVAGWRWVVYKFVLGFNIRLKELVVDQYQRQNKIIDKNSQQLQMQKCQTKSNIIVNNLLNPQLATIAITNTTTKITKQSQSTVDITNRDDGSKSKFVIQNRVIIDIDDDSSSDSDNNNNNYNKNNNNNDDGDEMNNSNKIIQVSNNELQQLQPLVKNNNKLRDNKDYQKNCQIIKHTLIQNNYNNSHNNNYHHIHTKTTPTLTHHLNIHQLNAFNKVFSHQSYCTLVQGMPGTGKTQLIVKIILQSYLLNQSVLITTYTNRSLDNILQRVFNQSILPIHQKHIIRQGSRYSIDPKFQKLNHRFHQFKTIEQYNKYFIQKKLWFVTLSSINIHHIPKQFDLVILDQASQSLQPVCLEALCRGKKFVMIGDYKQLQPIVKSKKADKMGMGVSLFQKLCIKYPQLSVALRLQYRMNGEIMKLSNKLVYDGELEMGSSEVANKRLKLPQQWQQVIQQQTLQQIISPTNPVTFLNHDGITNSLSSRHRQKYNQMSHVLQVQCAVFIYEMLIKMGIRQQQMQIVCVYNRTVDVVNEMVGKRSKRRSCDGGIVNKVDGKSDVGMVGEMLDDNDVGNQDKQRVDNKVNDNNFQKQKNNNTKNKNDHHLLTSHTPALTIDKSQGIDKQVIILLVEAHSSQDHRSLLESSRRLNVALTRAKSKLIMIGSMRHLKEMQVWKGQLAGMLEQKTYNMTKVLIDYILGEFGRLFRERCQQQLQKDKQKQCWQQQQKQVIISSNGDEIVI